MFLGALFTPENNEWTANIHRSIIRQISHYGLKEQWEATTIPRVKEELEELMFYSNLARMFLTGLFLFISCLVYLSHQKRKKEGRI